MIHIMNSAVMPADNWGTYNYYPATLGDLQHVLSGRLGDWQSAIGYPQNIDLIRQWTGVEIPLNRVETRFAHGDKAIIMRLRRRVADPSTKGAPVSADPNDWEFAWVEFEDFDDEHE